MSGVSRAASFPLLGDACRRAAQQATMRRGANRHIRALRSNAYASSAPDRRGLMRASTCAAPRRAA